jgi:hypothetical protein
MYNFVHACSNFLVLIYAYCICIDGKLEFPAKIGVAKYNHYFTVPEGPLESVGPHLPLALVIDSVPKKSRFSAPTASNGPCSGFRAQKALFSGAVESVFTSDGAQIDTKP